MRWTRRASSGALAALLALVLGGVGAHAQGKSAALIVDANTGQDIYAQSADEPRYPASLTKMMTLYIVFGLIEQGRLSTTTKIKMSQEAASAAPSKLDLEPGEEIALGDAIKALVTKSANDIAVAIAEHIGGSEQRFAQMMTERARQIGMRNTTFRNASGLPRSGQVTTARDMVTLGLRLHDDFPRLYALFATRRFAYHGNSYRNHNNLLFNYPGTEGIKTGYTTQSGFNVVVSVKRDRKHLVAAVFGGSTAGARDAHMRALLNKALPRASRTRTRKAEPMLVARAPAPKRAERPQRAAPVTREPVPEKKVVVAAAAAIQAEAPRAAPEPPVPVHVTRVRRVMVAPRPRSSDSIRGTEEAPPLLAERVSPASSRSDLKAPAMPTQGRLALAPSADAPLGATETAVGKSARAAIARPPSTLGAQAVALAAQGSATAVAPLRSSIVPQAGAPPQPTSDAPTRSKRAAVVVSEPASASRSRTPAAAPPAGGRTGATRVAAAGGFLIQVGAFATEAEATRQLTSVRQRAGQLLDGSAPTTEAVRKGSRQLYRARFAGFDAARAAATCTALRRIQVDCFVMRAE